MSKKELTPYALNQKKQCCQQYLVHCFLLCLVLYFSRHPYQNERKSGDAVTRTDECNKTTAEINQQVADVIKLFEYRNVKGPALSKNMIPDPYSIENTLATMNHIEDVSLKTQMV